MRRTAIFLVLICAGVMLSGCSIYSARFSPPVKQESNVVFKENDFHGIERNVSGGYSYWSLQLGAYPYMSLEIPLGDPRLFSNALADMYSKSQQQAEGKSTQFVNWTLDSNSWWIPIPFIQPVKKSVIFRADLVEYTK